VKILNVKNNWKLRVCGAAEDNWAKEQQLSAPSPSNRVVGNDTATSDFTPLCGANPKEMVTLLRRF
jgi:hypothetical protein